MKKKEVILTQREILVLAKCELVHRLNKANDLYSIYSDFVSRGLLEYLSCLESANEDVQDISRDYAYVDELLYKTSDCGWVSEERSED